MDIKLKFLKYWNRRLTSEEICKELNLDFSKPGKLSDLKFSRESPTPYIPSTYTPTPKTIDNYSKERAQEFLNKFQAIYSSQDDNKHVIATIIRLIVSNPDLVDLTEYDLLDLADSISKL